MNQRSATILICAFLLIQVFMASQAQPSSNKRPYRGTGGWTMNSIGYNAGLDALQKLFGKRDGIQGATDEDLTLAIGEDNIKELLDEFVSFLELKESGLLGPALVRCLRTELTSTVDK
uniref:uncharacterized protein LOC120333745 n=1 Tax=Styela clava TaxID=7725 RepID=UPI001939F4C5|nr:uncharacterized protein LOC120333745 [Styela clava]